MIKFISCSERETRKLAASFARKLRGGEVLALIGNLGSGKTTFVKGLAKALGIEARITSPTFVIANRYKVKIGRQQLALHHYDLYPLKRKSELAELGFGETLQNPKNIVAVEWPQKALPFLPSRTIYIRFAYGKTPTERIVSFENL